MPPESKDITPEQRKQIEEKLKSLSPEQLHELVKQQCVFCKIAKGEIPAKLVFEDKQIMAVLDARPATPGHVIIFTKEHYSILPQVPDSDIARMFALAKYISAAVFEATGAQGSNIFVANGALAGQGSPHALVHVIPRFEKDGLPQQWWEPKDLKAEQIDNIQKSIIANLKNVKITSMSTAETESLRKVSIKEKKKEPESGKTKLRAVRPRVP